MAGLADTARVYRTVLGNRSLRRVLLAFFFFNAEENAIWIAITLVAYDQGGATTAGIVSVAQLVPAAIVAPLASVLGDRMRRDHALALGYLIQSAAALACGLALLFAPVLVVYATAVVSACSITLTRPVHNAILPDLATSPEELTAANSVSSSAEGLGIMIGPLTTSLLFVISGPAAVLLTFAALMLAAAALTFRLDLQKTPTDDHDETGVVRAAIDGAKALRDDVPAAAVTLFGGAQFFILGMLDIFYAVLAIDVLGIGEEGAGLLAAAVGIGGLFGAVATAVLVGRRRLATPIEFAVGVAGGATAGLALVTAFGPAMLLLVVAGAARTFFDVAARTLLQRSVRADILSRVFGLQEAMLTVGLALGAGAAPLFISLFGEEGAFVAAGLLLPVAGLAVWPALRLLDRRATLPDPARFALFRELDLFRPLPQPVLERLVATSFTLQASAGDVVIREGDPGDRFYVLTAGEAVVQTGGREVVRVHPGRYFGEIALLRDVPRTATVRAVTDIEMVALDRDDFLDAVTGSRRSARAAHSEVDRRIAELGPGDP